jgi:hemoglobin
MVDYKVTSTKFGERPKFKTPAEAATPLVNVIGEEAFTKMVDDFYDIVADSEIAHFFPQDEAELTAVKKHNVKFFLEVSGGRPQYTQENGDVDMIQFHEKFSIREQDRLEWLHCFKEVLEKVDAPDDAKQSFWDYLEIFSKHLVNVKEEERYVYNSHI